MYTEEFEFVWKFYPRRLGNQGSKRVSFKKYERALAGFFFTCTSQFTQRTPIIIPLFATLNIRGVYSAYRFQ